MESKDWKGLDDYITRVVLTRTVGDVLRALENSSQVRGVFVASLIYNAIYGCDMDCMAQLAKRIDGTVPADQDRDLFANIMGDALEDVMDLPADRRADVYPDDLVIIAMAKVVLFLGSRVDLKKNSQLKKDRAKAVEMILERTGGRKTEPTRKENLLEYVPPDWLAGLSAPEEEQEDSQ